MVQVDGPARNGDVASDLTRPSLDPPEVKRILASWLADHPDALVGAATGSGLPTSVPPELGLSGYGQEERSILDLVVPDDTTTVTDAFVSALGRGFCITTVRLASNPDRPVLLHYVDLRSEHGVVLRLMAPATTGSKERRLSSQELAPTRPRVGFMTKDEVATIIGVDEATTLMLGWSAQEMIGRRSLSFIHPEDHLRAIDNWMGRRSNRATRLGTVRLRYLCQDGTWLWLETSNEFSEQADGSEVVSTQLIDISSEMAASEALQRSESLLRLVTDTVPVGLFHVGTLGEVSFVNPVAQRLLGQEPAGTASGLWAQLAPARGCELDAAMERVLAEGTALSLDIEFEPADTGVRSSCQVSLQPVTDHGRTAGVLGCIVDVTELRQIADTDALTGVQSRRAIMQALEQELALGGNRVAVLYVDLDDFKPVNDQHGHGAGDRVLAGVAHRLMEAVRPGDHVGRLGGDEFLVVCPGCEAPGVMAIGRRIQALLAAPAVIDGHRLTTGASIGISCGRPGVTAEELVAEADVAMYRAKHDKGGPPVLLPVGVEQVTTEAGPPA